MWLLLLLASNVITSAIGRVEDGNIQGKLVDDVMQNYGSGIVRPVFNTSTVTTVIFRAKIHEVIELDARNQRITVSTNLKQVWHDEFVHWEPNNYGGISKIHLPIEQIWHPDITLHRNIDSDFERIKHTNAIILSNGTVTWFAPAIFTSSCRMHVQYFPFDTQVCTLRYSSWSYNGEEIDLITDPSNDSIQDSFLENGVWDLLEVHTEREVSYYTCCPEPYPELLFTIVLKRRSTFYIAYLILPCVFLSALSLLVFYLPAEGGEKLTLAITNLLALVVFQQLVAESMPPSGEDPPLIGDYFLAMIIMVCVSVVTTVLVIHVTAKTGPVPYWAQIVFLHILSRATCMHREELNQPPPRQKMHNSETSDCGFTLLEIDGKVGGDKAEINHDVNQNGAQSSMIDDLHFIRKDIEDKNNEERIMSQWKHVARVFDRCLLIIFMMYATFTTMMLLIRAKGPEEHSH